MQGEENDSRLATAPPPEARVALHRWIAVGAMVAAEYGLLSTKFDAYPLIAAGGTGAWLGNLGTIAPLALTVVTVAIALGGRRLSSALDAVEITARARLVGGLVVHGALFIALYVLTQRVFGHPHAPSLALAITWSAVAVAAPVAAFAAAFRLGAMLPLARQLWRPLAWAAGFGSLAWGAALLSEWLWEPLGRATVVLAGGLLSLASGQAFFDPNTATLGIGEFGVRVAPVCSGYEGVGLIIVVVGAYLLWARKDLRFPNALLLLPLSVVLVFAANVLRIAGLVLLGASGAQGIALGGFHAKAGWVLFCAVALGVVAWARRSSFVQKELEQPIAGASDTTAYLLPLLAWVAAAMVTGLLTTTFDRWYAARIVPALAVLWIYRRAYALPSRPSWWVGPAFGVVAYLAWIALSPRDPHAGEALRAAVGGLGGGERTAWLTAKVIGSVAVVPLVEELAFRGYALRRLVRADFTSVSYRNVTIAAVLLSSLAFGLLHQQIIAGTVAGVLFALAARQRGRLADAVVAHAVANALIALQVLLLGAWPLWT